MSNTLGATKKIDFGDGKVIEIETGKIMIATRFHNDGSEFLKATFNEQQGDTTYQRFYENGELENSSRNWSYQQGSMIYSFSEGEDSDGNTFYMEQETDLNTAYNKVEIKTTGFGFLGPFLAAFVEPDEKQMQKKTSSALQFYLFHNHNALQYTPNGFVLYLLAAKPPRLVLQVNNGKKPVTNPYNRKTHYISDSLR